jgi:hypothetical protein
MELVPHTLVIQPTQAKKTSTGTRTMTAEMVITRGSEPVTNRIGTTVKLMIKRKNRMK